MEIFDRFETVGNQPALYDPETDTAIVADLHLGLESLMARDGVYMPKFQLEDVKEDLETVIAANNPARLVVCGDLKHEFSETSHGERKEVQELLEFLADRVDEVLLAKGNHDNYLIYAVEEYSNVELEDRFILDNVVFIHGHELQEDLEMLDAEYVVIGHEHPAVTLTDDIGVKEKIPVFLYGEIQDGRSMVVMPAFSRLAEGSQVNRIDEEELLSPLLKERAAIGEMKAIGVDREAGLFEFPELEKLR